MSEASKSILEMSDEELEKLSENDFIDEPIEEEEESDSNSLEDSSNQEEVSDDTDDPVNEEDEVEEDSILNSADDSIDETVEEDEQSSDTVKGSVDKDKKEESTDNVDKTPEIDYKEAYERVLNFKANGKEVELTNVDEAVRLLQMGVNYNSKMAALKEPMRFLKQLEKNDLLDEEKLNYLIDLSNKDKGAIQKLLQDSEIDPLDLDMDSDTSYTPNSHAVDQKEMEVDEVLDDLRASPTFADITDWVGNKADQQSKTIIYENPELLKTLSEHMNNGIYDIVNKEYEKQQILGNFKGVPTIVAYKQVGDMINAQGGFDHLSNESQKSPSSTSTNSNKNSNRNIAQKKKAAARTKGAVSKKPSKEDFNPLAMSDEEFDKFSSNNF